MKPWHSLSIDEVPKALKEREEWKAIGSPDEAALLVAAKKLGLDYYPYEITNEVANTIISSA